MFMTTEILTAARLREVLNYEPETGAFTRLVPALMPNGSVRIPVGAVAGGINGDGYVVIKVCGKEHRAHRLAWLYVHGGGHQTRSTTSTGFGTTTG